MLFHILISKINALPDALFGYKAFIKIDEVGSFNYRMYYTSGFHDKQLLS